jgi:dTDP-4-amino-4,6-dideoxygalactose transaminase
MGPEVRQFEAELAAFGQAPLSLSCANGTDAIALPLMAWGVGRGDAVFCPSFTFTATPEVVPWVEATPVFVDVLPDTFNIDPAALEAAIEGVKADGKLKPAVVIAVDLFGQPADYPALRAVCDRHGLKLISDSAQGFGCTLNGKHPIHWADVATTSFFPAKPLGCYGDGGAVVLKDQALWDLMDSFRVHGKAVAQDLNGRVFEHESKYLNARIGMNSRLDSIQAAILIEKLAILEEEMIARQKVAERYAKGLAGVVRTARLPAGNRSAWAQYAIETPVRDGLKAHLQGEGIPSVIYYVKPLHLQDAYKHFPRTPGGLAVSEALPERILCLPMHPYLSEADQDRIIETIAGYVGHNAATAAE